MAKIENGSNRIWDLDGLPFNIPSKVRKVYEKNYIKNRAKITNWLDSLSKNNGDDLDWWMLSITLRDPYKSKLLDYITSIETIRNIKDSNIKISSKSYALINLLKYRYQNKNQFFVENSSFLKITVIKNLIKNFLFQILLFVYVKVFEKRKIKKENVILVDKFVTSNYVHNDSFLTIKKKNIYTVPTFIPTLNIFRLFKIIKIFKKKEKKYLFKESFINFSDILFAFGHYFRRRNFLNKSYNFQGLEIDSLIKEEIKNFDDFSSISTGILNFKFFQRLEENEINVISTFNWFENQLIDKGWNLGFRKFYQKNQKNCFGYQDFSKHYNYLNHSPSKLEYASRVTPEKIILISKNFTRSTKEFFKKQKVIIGETWRFKKYLNIRLVPLKKRKKILFILCGVKEIDKILLSIAVKLCGKIKPIQVFIKFHPILDPKYLKVEKKYPENLIFSDEKLFKSLKDTFIAITSGPSSALLESSSSGAFCVIPNIECGTKKNLDILNLKSNQYFITENIDQTISQIIYIFKKKNKLKNVANKLIKSSNSVKKILNI